MTSRERIRSWAWSLRWLALGGVAWLAACVPDGHLRAEPLCESTCGGVCDKGACHGEVVGRVSAGSPTQPPEQITRLSWSQGGLYACLNFQNWGTLEAVPPLPSTVPSFFLGAPCAGLAAPRDDGTLVGAGLYTSPERQQQLFVQRYDIAAALRGENARTEVQIHGVTSLGDTLVVGARLLVTGAWGDEPDGISSIDLASGVRTRVPATTASQSLGALAVSPGGIVVVASPGAWKVFRVDLDAGGMTVLLDARPAADAPASLPVLAADETHVYAPLADGVWRAPLAGDAPAERLADASNVTGLVVDAEAIYWTEGLSGRLRRLDKVTRAVTTLAVDLEAPVSLVQHDDWLAWGEPFARTIRKLHKGRGLP